MIVLAGKVSLVDENETVHSLMTTKSSLDWVAGIETSLAEQPPPTDQVPQVQDTLQVHQVGASFISTHFQSMFYRIQTDNDREMFSLQLYFLYFFNTFWRLCNCVYFSLVFLSTSFHLFLSILFTNIQCFQTE